MYTIGIVTLARLAFKNDRGMQQKLQINGPRKAAREEWLAQAMRFYGKMEEISGAMPEYGVIIR